MVRRKEAKPKFVRGMHKCSFVFLLFIEGVHAVNNLDQNLQELCSQKINEMIVRGLMQKVACKMVLPSIFFYCRR
jgi:hypothetical protein